MYYIFDDWSYNNYLLLYKFFTFFFILCGSFVLHNSKYDRKRFFFNDKFLLLLVIFFLVFIFGTRGYTIGTDTGNYYNFYYLKILHLSNFIDKWNTIQTDFLFKVLLVISSIIKSYYFFLFIVSLTMNWALYSFVRKFTNNSRDGSSFFLLLMIMCSFSMVSIQANIIRSGISFIFFLIALNFIFKNQKKLAFLNFLISFFFHFTIIIPIILVIIIILDKSKSNLNFYYYLYALVILLSSLNFGFYSIDFLLQSSNENIKALTSLEGHEYYRTGFRLDFVIYNSFFLFLFWKLSKMNNPKNIFMIKYYILASCFFFLSFNMPHSDRLGLYSWIIIPILLFNIFNTKYKRTRLTKLTRVLILYFILNHIILF